jgi:hypothetical protein
VRATTSIRLTPALFVHSVPETRHLWDELRIQFKTEWMALTFPGFGIPRPAGFAAAKDDPAEWHSRSLSYIDRPIDRVGPTGAPC